MTRYPVPTEPPPTVPAGYVAVWHEEGAWLILPTSFEERLRLVEPAYRRLAAFLDREDAAKEAA